MITIPRIPQRHRRTDGRTGRKLALAIPRYDVWRTNGRTDQQTDKHLCCDYRLTCACV